MRTSPSFWCYPDPEQELAVTDALRTAVAIAESAGVARGPCSASGDRQPGGWEESGESSLCSKAFSLDACGSIGEKHWELFDQRSHPQRVLESSRGG